jgi:hypothetical protein
MFRLAESSGRERLLKHWVTPLSETDMPAFTRYSFPIERLSQKATASAVQGGTAVFGGCKPLKT